MKSNIQLPLRILTMIWLMTMLLMRFNANGKEHLFKSTCSVLVIGVGAAYIVFLFKQILSNRRGYTAKQETR